MHAWSECHEQPIVPMSVTVGGVIAPDHLVGRQTELEQIHNAIIAANGAVLVGDRRMGKTSILRTVEKVLTEAGHRIISVSAETLEPATFASRLDDKLRPATWLTRERQRWDLGIEVTRFGVKIRRTTEQGDTQEEDLFAWAANKAAPGRLIVIIDELTVLLGGMTDSPGDAAEFMHSLRRARQEHSNLTLILAGSIGLHHVVPQGHGTTNDLTGIVVDRLGECDAYHLARCLIAGNEIVTDDEQALAWELTRVTDAIPYYIQFLVQQMPHGRQIGPAEVDPLLQAVIDNTLDPLDFGHYLSRLEIYYEADAELAKRCLDHYATGGPLGIDDVMRRIASDDIELRPSRGDLVEMVKRFERDHYLRRLPNNTNEFASSVLRRGWRSVRRLS
jgi:hypothetical protein